MLKFTSNFLFFIGVFLLTISCKSSVTVDKVEKESSDKISTTEIEADSTDNEAEVSDNTVSVEGSPKSFSLSTSPFFNTTPFRAYGVNDEITVSITLDPTSQDRFYCSFAGAGYSQCLPSNQAINVAEHSSGGEFCVQSGIAGSTQRSEAVCITLPSFKAVSCDESISENMSYESFAALLSDNKTFCFDDGVVIENPVGGTYGALNIIQSDVTLIARVGDTAQFRNSRIDTASYLTSVGMYINGDRVDLVGLQIDTYGPAGIVIYSKVSEDSHLIGNLLKAHHSAVGVTIRAAGVLLEGQNGDSMSGSMVGNTINGGTGDDSRGVEIRRADSYRLEDNIIELNCLPDAGAGSGDNMCYGLYVKNEAAKPGENFIFNRNTIKHIGQTDSHGVLFDVQPETEIVSFNENVISLKEEANSLSAINSNATVTEAKGNTICILGASHWTATITGTGNVGSLFADTNNNNTYSVDGGCAL